MGKRPFLFEVIILNFIEVTLIIYDLQIIKNTSAESILVNFLKNSEMVKCNLDRTLIIQENIPSENVLFVDCVFGWRYPSISCLL